MTFSLLKTPQKIFFRPPKFQHKKFAISFSLACSAGGFWWGEWIYISIGCSGRHLDIVESWGEVKSFPSEGERKKNWGRGRGRGKKKVFFSLPRPPPLRHSVILAPILPVCSESKIAANHSIDHQNRLHCRLVFPYLVKLNDNGSYHGLREPIRKLENHYPELKIY